MHSGARRLEDARKDMHGSALLAMPEGMLMIDVRVMHALAVMYLQGTVAASKSVEVDCAAAAVCEPKKKEEYRSKSMVAPSTSNLFAGRLGAGAMRIINRLAKCAADYDGVEKLVFVQRMQGALSVVRPQGACGTSGCKRWHLVVVVASRRVMTSPMMTWADTAT